MQMAHTNYQGNSFLIFILAIIFLGQLNAQPLIRKCESYPTEKQVENITQEMKILYLTNNKEKLNRLLSVTLRDKYEDFWELLNEIYTSNIESIRQKKLECGIEVLYIYKYGSGYFDDNGKEYITERATSFLFKKTTDGIEITQIGGAG